MVATPADPGATLVTGSGIGTALDGAEVILNLGRIHHDKSEVALVGYLRTFEVMALKPETAAYDSTEVLTLLDRRITERAARDTTG